MYSSLFGSNGAATVNGRMVGITRFFKTDAAGNITYPSNHYINARTSKDVLDNFPDAELIDINLIREDEPND